MTEGDYLKAMELLREVERNIRQGDYDFAHINVLEVLDLLGETDDERLWWSAWMDRVQNNWTAVQFISHNQTSVGLDDGEPKNNKASWDDCRGLNVRDCNEDDKTNEGRITWAITDWVKWCHGWSFWLPLSWYVQIFLSGDLKCATKNKPNMTNIMSSQVKN